MPRVLAAPEENGLNGMDELKVYYRAFREYREKMAGCADHDQLIAGLESGTGTASFNGQLRRCVWDEAWIETMLAGLPFVERALEEQRRFIESNAEVRRVDQARRTTVESVRHLAQHSNLISRLDGEDIIPDKLLIVERDDSYDIYENRFLFTLVLKMQSFLAERYAAVAEINESEGFSLELERSAVWNRQRMGAGLRLSYERRPARNRSDIDVSEMTAMERVNHLRQRTSQLLNTPLMRQLKGVSPLHPPIVRTNVFKKNENFRRALELYEYLEHYQGPGYQIVMDEPKASTMEEALRGELYEVLALENFVGRMAASGELRDALEANFQRENELAEQERIRREEAREREVQARIQAAREEEIQIREAEVARREAVIQARNQQIARLDQEKAELERQRAETDAENARLTEQLEQAQARCLNLETRLAQQRQARAQAEGETGKLRIQLQEQRSAQLQALKSLEADLQQARQRRDSDLMRQENRFARERAALVRQLEAAEQRVQTLQRGLREAEQLLRRNQKQVVQLQNRLRHAAQGGFLRFLRRKEQ